LPKTEKRNMKNKDKYINRELSWLQFDRRVLDEASNITNFPLDRLLFLTITASNLDEFIMVRVGGLKLLVNSNEYQVPDIVDMTPKQQLEAISKEYKKINQDQYKTLKNIQAELNNSGIVNVSIKDLSPKDLNWLANYFDTRIMPVITPMKLDLNTKVPALENLSMYELVVIKNDDPQKPFLYAAIPLQRMLQRMVRLPSVSENDFRYLFVEDIAKLFMEQLFQGKTIVETFPFRLTRNGDIAIEEEFSENLAAAMQSVLNGRLSSDCVRIEVPEDAGKESVKFLQNIFNVDEAFTIRTPGPVDLTAFKRLCFSGEYPKLAAKPWMPHPSPDIVLTKSIFKQIKDHSVLLFHPYESFDPVVKFVQKAAEDPDVLAIKQVLYRTSTDSPILRALITAAENKKYVTAVVEIKARFDEANNLHWAKKLEDAGIQVIYGVKGLKTHSKICLVVRNESSGIVRYVHYGTGNYNDATAKIYSDVGYLTADPELGMDAARFFNAVTGLSDPIPYNKIYQSPYSIKEKLLELIASEAERAKDGQEALIMAKFNSLVDKEIIDALYAASKDGVKIRLNVRGICCLRPGEKNLSENIKVISILDRFLEHARILYFHQGGDPLLFISSADWMERNLEKRIELLIPIEEEKAKEKLIQILMTSLSDTMRGRMIKSDGTYDSPKKNPKIKIRSQEVFYKMAVAQSKRKKKNKRTRFEPHKK